MQLQARIHRKSLHRRPLPFEIRALHSAVQARLNKSDLIPTTVTLHTGPLKMEMSVDTTSDQNPQQIGPVTQQTAQSEQSHVEACTDESSATNYTRTPFDEKIVLPIFRNELDSLFAVGQALKQIEDECHGKVQDNAIAALSKILGVRQRFFNPVDGAPEAIRVLFDDLYQQCKNRNLKGRTKRTTEFHLLSRLLRGSDRKQASADAKILIRAQLEGQTEQTFAAWVAKQGSLSIVLKGVTDHEKTNQQEKREESKKDKAKCTARVIDAISAAQKAQAWAVFANVSIEDVPQELKDLDPPSGGWMPIVLARHGDSLCFYTLDKADQNNSGECPDVGSSDVAESDND